MKRTNSRSEISVLWTMDCEAPAELSHEGGPANWDLAERSIRGYCELVSGYGFRATLFVVPAAARRLASVFRDLAREGVEVGLHCHPQDQGSGDYLGGLRAEEQRDLLSAAAAGFADALGFSPKSFRAGNFSANDSTYPVLADLGFTATSTACPGRAFSRVRSVWCGAPEEPYHPSAANRLVAGDLPLVEVPLTVDRDSVMWGGLTPLELRVEMVDGRAHGFTMRKVVDRQVAGGRCRYLMPMTHNLFDYSKESEFRRTVVVEMAGELKRWEEQLDRQVVGPTLSDFVARPDTPVLGEES